MALTTEPVVSGRRGLWSLRARPASAVADDPTEVVGVADLDEAPLRAKRRSWGVRYASRLAVTDMVALALASVAVHLLTLPNHQVALVGEPTYLPYVALTLSLLVVWALALSWSGSRDPKSIGYGALEYKRIIQATFAVFGVVAISSYLFKLELPRSYLLIMMPAGLVALLASRFAWRRWLHRRRVGSSRVDLQACKLEYSIVSPK